MKKFLTLFTALLLFGSMTVVQAVTYTPAGSPASVFGSEWAPDNADNDMTLSNGLYVFAKKDNFSSQTSISFKVCKDHGWGTAYPGSNYGFTIPAGAQYLIITYNTSGNAVNAFAISSMTVAGDNATLFGSTWAPTATANDMTLQNDGTYKFEKEHVALSAGTVKFKACANHGWDNAWPSDNYSLSIPESGNYTITITFDPKTLSVSASADLEEAVVVIPNIQLHSNIKNPSWESSADFNIAGNEETASLTLTDVAKGNYEFGIKIDGTWTSNGSAFTRANPSHAIASGSGNCTFNADVAGDYTFTWTYADNSLSVTYPALPTYTVDFVGLENIYFVNDVVNFSATSTGVDNPTYTYYVKKGDADYGAAVASYTFAETGSYTVKVEVRENGAGDALKAEEQTVTVDNPLTLYFVNKDSWANVNIYFYNPNKSDWPGDAMTATGDETEVNHYAVYSFTVPASVYGSANVIFNNGSGTQTSDLSVNAKHYFCDGEWYATLAETDVPPTPDTYTVVGAVPGLNWDQTSSANDMTEDNGVYTLVLEDVELAVASYEYKIAKNHSWDGAYPQSGNASFSIETAGIYDLTFTLDLSASPEYSVTPTLIQEIVVIPAVKMTGTFADGSSWTETAEFTLAGNEESASLTIENLPEGDYLFKMIVGSSYLANGYTYHREYTGASFDSNGENMTIQADVEGDYTFTWTYATNTLNITFPAIPEPDAFVAGSAAEIFGTAWTSDIAANQMIWDEDLAKYKKVYAVDKAYKSVALKVVYGGSWYGVEGGEDNVKFSLSGAGEFTVLFDKNNHYVTVEGAIVGDEQFDFEYVTVAGNGSGNWLNGKNWDVAAEANRMTAVAADIYEISFTGVPAEESKFQFSFNGAWDYQFGGVFSGFGAAATAVYGNSGGDITFTPVAGAEITIRLDLSNFDFVSKEGATFTVSQAEPIAEIGGKFIINAKGDTAVFSRGNLQYKQSADAWRCAPNQYDWQGMENLQMGNPDYAGWVDLFSWSLGAENNYGATSAYLSTAYHNKDFVDWGTKFEGEWATLSSAQWQYLLNTRAGADDKWGMAMIEDNLGMILLPNEWEAPAGVTFVPRTNPTSELWDEGDMIDATNDHYRVHPENMPANKFTLAEWAELEAAGAVFLPYAGRRSGGVGNHTNRDDQEVVAEYNYTYYENYLGTYWTSTSANKAEGTANYVYTFKFQKVNEEDDYQWGKAVIWGENGRYGQSVRLVHIIPRQYTVTYTAGEAEGDVPVDAQTYVDGQEITLAAASGLSKDGYRFAGWKFKGQIYNGSYTVNNVLANEEIVFEAQWEVDWQIVRSELTEGWYYTMCLDKAVANVQGGSIWRVLSMAANGTDVILEEVVGTLDAGRPYIFFATESELQVVYTGDAVGAPVNDDANNGLIGSFVQAHIENVNTNYIIYNNALYYVNSDNVYVGAHRAYLNMPAVPAYGDEPGAAEPVQGNAPRRVVMNVHGEQVATGIEMTNDQSQITNKVLVNGQLYILRGEKMYDATGRLVK